ncbi:hypothetical protein MKX07_008031 [Trichoderma sp. CBMAI-0711]|nr:hypothetical protein MKX07_008031 [Trichoderma sp. CBMAI-0711]
MRLPTPTIVTSGPTLRQTLTWLRSVAAQPATGVDLGSRSGPAKGYIEALEHRLAVTEAVLLQLLQVSDDSLLQDAFKHEPAKRADVPSAAAIATTTTTDAAGRIEAKKTGTIAHWDSFPLNTADEVKRWAGEVLGRRADALQASRNTPEETDQRSFNTYPIPPDPLSGSRPEKSSPNSHRTCHGFWHGISKGIGDR